MKVHIRKTFKCEFLLARLRAKRFDMEVKMSFAETFKALSDPARRQILELLKQGPMSAGEIGSHFDMTGATISYHLGDQDAESK